MSKYQYNKSTLVPVLGYTALALFLANFCVFLHKHILPKHGHEVETLCLAEGEMAVNDASASFHDLHKRHRHHRRHMQHRVRVIPQPRHEDGSFSPKDVEISFSSSGNKIYVQRLTSRGDDTSSPDEKPQVHVIRRDGKLVFSSPNFPQDRVHTIDALHPNTFKLRLQDGRVLVGKEQQELKDLDVQLREFDGTMLDLDLELKQLEEQVKLDLDRINAEQQNDEMVSLKLKPSAVVNRR
jgi:hypothetical protein